MKIYGITKIGPKGQVVIPQEARKDLNLNPGDKVVIFSPYGKGVLILPEKELKKRLKDFKKLFENNEI